jgi:hypothetical protein
MSAAIPALPVRDRSDHLLSSEPTTAALPSVTVVGSPEDGDELNQPGAVSDRCRG